MYPGITKIWKWLPSSQLDILHMGVLECVYIYIYIYCCIGIWKNVYSWLLICILLHVRPVPRGLIGSFVVIIDSIAWCIIMLCPTFRQELFRIFVCIYRTLDFELRLLACCSLWFCLFRLNVSMQCWRQSRWQLILFQRFLFDFLRTKPWLIGLTGNRSWWKRRLVWGTLPASCIGFGVPIICFSMWIGDLYPISANILLVIPNHWWFKFLFLFDRQWLSFSQNLLFFLLLRMQNFNFNRWSRACQQRKTGLSLSAYMWWKKRIDVCGFVRKLNGVLEKLWCCNL